MTGESTGQLSRQRHSLLVRLLVGALLLAAFGVLFYFFRQELSLAALAQRESQLRGYQQTHPLLTYGVAFILYVVVTALSLPGAAVMSLTYGWLFGFWPALVLVSFASTTGATLAFLLSRFLIGQTIQARFGERLASFNAALDREGVFYLFSLRLTPVVPFFVINAVMGLTKIRVWTYWWVSQLGMLPGTCLFLYAGSTVPTLGEIAERGTASILRADIIAAFVALGLFPLVVKKLVEWMKKRRMTNAQ